MERRSFYVGLISFSLLTACSPPKGVDNVFPESQPESIEASNCSAQVLSQQFIVSWESGNISVEHDSDAKSFIQHFVEPHLREIKHVEFDQVIKVPETTFRTAPKASLDPHWGQKMIEAEPVWNQGYGGDGIKIGIVDTGVDTTHPQLAKQVLFNETELNGVPGKDNDGNGFVGDVQGWDFYLNQPMPTLTPDMIHGTHVTGIAVADSAEGQAWGLAPHAKFIPASFLGPDGSGSLSNAVLALRYVASRKVNVVNASWGSGVCSQTLRDQISSLNDQGILFITAAGNDGVSLDTKPEFPGAFVLPNQITVAAATSSDRMASFSNTSFGLVNLAAPGENIFSTTPQGGGYLSGTSMATPFVTGAAAVVWSVRPSATHLQVKQAILNSVDVKGYRVSTRGRLNLRKAVEEIKRLVPEHL